MLRSTLAVLLVASLGLVQPVSLMPASAGPFLERLQARMAAREAGSQVAPATEYAYGPDPLQRLDVWQARGGAAAPLVVFVHGGGWKRGDKRNATGAAKVEHLLAQGYAFASIDYRLVPAATVEQQAADVAAALAWLHNNAARLGIDSSRVVLMGHSAGAHLVALVGTDPRYFTAAGLSLRDISGIIALDGACYDVARQLADSGRFMLDTYIQAFGTEPARQRALSPTLQAAKPNAPAFLILHVDRADGKAQSEALGAALTQAGTPAEVQGVGGTGLRGHMEINRELGDPSHPATAIVDAWLRRMIGAR
ncbi:putative para-nitrobenzyl esterase [Bradyrhizobium sp. ORS 285]|uniref:alpha/beta hydrolase n=1 Tax=Bradyrhizobium sp. ORS 285 TaxID=115808 RepID=UPI0002408FCD|nr:alpha/beta hydrolase [Bradyrhizobium sp. ORS 285]CCD88651.1 putative para-nitrobenzyl esterase [Bradyrhizobium sp. ORS 285]SMX56245.1 putative para-nitrobenzyl esterase [Bradyrhizobium sp. ORS 285]